MPSPDLSAFRNALKREIWARAANPACAGLRIANGGLEEPVRRLSIDGTETVASNYGFLNRPLANAFSVVALCENRLIGHASFEINFCAEDAVIHMAGIFVDADHRGTGVARAMIAETAEIIEAAVLASLDADPDAAILSWLDTVPSGDFTNEAQRFAGLLEERLNAFVEAQEEAVAPTPDARP